jgi:1-acyl-sn-glycerol-3-phosphate acyltransferase
MKLVDFLIFYFLLYPLGILLGLGFSLLRLIGRIKVLYYERLPKKAKNVVLVSNHPSLLEPFLLPALWFPEYVFQPLKSAPWSTPDRKNFYKEWYWFWLRPRAIPIKRGDEKEERRAFFEMKRVLESGGRLILFPEAGRTFKGKKFFLSKNGKKIRELKNGIGWLALKARSLIVPVWVEGTDEVLPNESWKIKFWKRVIIKIGQPLKFTNQKISPRFVTLQITQSLLKLAEE